MGLMFCSLVLAALAMDVSAAGARERRGPPPRRPKVINGCEIKRDTSCPDADLQGASLPSANLDNANLNGANLDNANLHGANLENAGYLEQGDAVRLTAAGAPKLTADPASGAEVLIWQTELPARN